MTYQIAGRENAGLYNTS